jgi:hypothetical protein
MQHGSIIQATRKQGPDVWQFRWSEKDLCLPKTRSREKRESMGAGEGESLAF